MTFPSPIAATSRLADGGPFFGGPPIRDAFEPLALAQPHALSSSSSNRARWPPHGAGMASPEGSRAVATGSPERARPTVVDTSLTPPAARSHLKAVFPLTETTNFGGVGSDASRLAKRQNQPGLRTVADTDRAPPRLVEPPPPDVDVFAFNDLDADESQIQSVVTAAMATARLHYDLVNSVNRLTAAARQQHADAIALAHRQQCDNARLEAAWSVAASVRKDTQELSADFDRHTRGAAEITDFTRRELARHDKQIASLLRRTRRNEMLLRDRAVTLLGASNRERFGKGFLLKWRRYSLLRRTCARLAGNSALYVLRTRVNTWRRFVARRRQMRIWFRQLDLLEDKNNKVIARRAYSRLLAFARVRRLNRTAAGRLAKQSSRFVALSFFRRWMHAARAKSLLRVQLTKHLQISSEMSRRVHGKVIRQYFAKWRAFLQQRRVGMRRLRLVRLECRRVQLDHTRRRFVAWMLAARSIRKRREAFVALCRSNACILAGKFFRKWERLRWQRWVMAYTHSQIVPIERKIDIGLRTTANTNETIQKLIENFQFLDSKLQELRLSSRMGMFSARDSSVAPRPDDEFTGAMGPTAPTAGASQVSHYAAVAPLPVVQPPQPAGPNPYLGLGPGGIDLAFKAAGGAHATIAAAAAAYQPRTRHFPLPPQPGQSFIGTPARQ